MSGCAHASWCGAGSAGEREKKAPALGSRQLSSFAASSDSWWASASGAEKNGE